MTDLSRRDMAALVGMLLQTPLDNPESCAEKAVKYADALIAELDRTAPKQELSKEASRKPRAADDDDEDNPHIFRTKGMYLTKQEQNSLASHKSNETVVHASTAAALSIAQQQISTLFEAIKHGDEKHQAWLKQAIEDHFAGRPVQRDISKPGPRIKEGGLEWWVNEYDDGLPPNRRFPHSSRLEASQASQSACDAGCAFVKVIHLMEVEEGEG